MVPTGSAARIEQSKSRYIYALGYFWLSQSELSIFPPRVPHDEGAIVLLARIAHRSSRRAAPPYCSMAPLVDILRRPLHPLDGFARNVGPLYTTTALWPITASGRPLHNGFLGTLLVFTVFIVQLTSPRA